MSLSLNSLYYLSKDLGFAKSYPLLNYIHFTIPVLIPVSAYFYVFYLRPIPKQKKWTWFEYSLVLPVVLDAAYFIINGLIFTCWGEAALSPSWTVPLNIAEECNWCMF
ncbi:MAG: hypothetical protein HC913_23990, partial [Microscillaceae bacterium]|nr:hypothetical protein [Microscillaceae bacterium]